MDDLKDKAAIFLEEMGVSGDAQIGIDDEHAPEEEMKGGAYYLHDLLAAFVDEVEASDVPLMRLVSGTRYSAIEWLERAVRGATPRGKINGEPIIECPRWVAVRDLFGCGSTYAIRLCQQFDLDPNENISRA
jgi:hypothetical protein